MFISDVSIKRPVFATMLNFVLIVFGLFSLPRLAVDQYPNVDFPFITATIVYPGADPASVEQRILKPLEKAVNGISGLDDLMSTAYPSLGQIVLKFKLDKNGDQAAQETRDKIFAALSELPTEAETPIIQKFDVAGAPILSIALTGSKDIPYGRLSQIAADQVQPALERINGVAAVNTAGIREREVHVRVDRDRLASFGLTPADVINSIQQQNIDVPAGKIDNKVKYWSLRVKGRLANGAEIAALPIMAQGVTGLKISDVANIEDTIAEETTAAYVGRESTILLTLQKQAGANTTGVAKDARQELETIKSQLPPGVRLEVVQDNSIYIKGSIDSVKLDLVLGALLATFIVLIFLRDWRITLISAIALPTSVIATFAFMNWLGFTLNMMSTLGLSLAIGILIDDAIIVIENIARHLEMGKTGAQAAHDATSEIGLAVMATTLTLCAVFIPVAFMEGIIGRFFYQFGLTVAFAVLVSLFVAFTLTPMLAARLLKGHAGGHHVPHNKALAAIWNAIERALTSLDNGYRKLLGWCLAHRWTTVGFGFLMFILAAVMLKFVPVSFFPKEDRSQLAIDYTLPEGTTLEVSKAKAFQVVDEIEKYPGVDKVVTAIAATREAKPNKVRFDVLLVDKAARNFTQEELLSRMRTDLSSKYAVNGAEFVISEAGGGGGGGRQEPIQLIFKGDNWDQLVAFTEEAKKYIQTSVPGAVDVNTSKPKNLAEYRVQVDPARAADLGVSTGQIGQALRSLFEGDKIGEIEQSGSTYDVRLRISDRDRTSPEDVVGISVTSRTGQRVTLDQVTKLVLSDAPAQIERFDGQRQIVVYANFTGKDLNAASQQIQGWVKQHMPPSVTYALSGQTQILADSVAAMLKALALAILLVYMILCAQYERYLAPLVIMSALPLSFTGAFGALLISGQVMSVFTMIGLILLMGLVTKNGILLIDFTLQRMQEGESVNAALLEAGPVRLRPILMTTFAAGGGMIPIAIGHGVGGESRAPLGVSVIGGLLVSTLLTLVVVPCLFSLVEGMSARIRRWRDRRKAQRVEAKTQRHAPVVVSGGGRG